MKQFYASLSFILVIGLTSFVSGQSSSEKGKAAPSVLSPAALLTVTAPTMSVSAASAITATLQVTDTTGQGVLGYRGEITFNQNVIQTSGLNAGCTVAGTISSSMSPVCNETIIDATTHKIIFFVSGITPLAGAGALIKFNFQVVGAAASTSPLVFTDFFFNEGGPTDPTDAEVNGLVTVLSPTAAGASVSGSVVSSSGRPVSSVQITLSDGAGFTRMAISNPFGFYSFADVPTGSVYVLSATSKRSVFQSRVFALTDDLAGVDLVAEP